MDLETQNLQHLQPTRWRWSSFTLLINQTKIYHSKVLVRSRSWTLCCSTLLHHVWLFSSICARASDDLFVCLWRDTDGHQRDADAVAHVNHHKLHVDRVCLCISCTCVENSHHAWIWFSLRGLKPTGSGGKPKQKQTCAADQTRSLKINQVCCFTAAGGRTHEYLYPRSRFEFMKSLRLCSRFGTTAVNLRIQHEAFKGLHQPKVVKPPQPGARQSILQLKQKHAENNQTCSLQRVLIWQQLQGDFLARAKRLQFFFCVPKQADLNTSDSKGKFYLPSKSWEKRGRFQKAGKTVEPVAAVDRQQEVEGGKCAQGGEEGRDGGGGGGLRSGGRRFYHHQTSRRLQHRLWITAPNSWGLILIKHHD